MTQAKKIDLIIKILGGQVRLTNAHTLALHDHSLMIYNVLSKCVRCKVSPHTVTFTPLELKYCDRCAAETIVSSKTPAKTVTSLEARLISYMMSQTESWEDIENANPIRGLVDYLKEVEVMRSRKIMH